MKNLLITQREETSIYGGKIDSLEAEYVKFFSNLGFNVIPVSNFNEKPRNYFDVLECDCLVLSGGGMLFPEAYVEKIECPRQLHREFVERELIEEAIKRNISIIGICHGMQVLNSFFGGKMISIKNLESHKVGKEHHIYSLKTRDKFVVNSYHDYAVYRNTLGRELLPLFVSSEGFIVEMFQHERKNIIGIQWHPERMSTNTAEKNSPMKIVKEFLGKC